MNSNVRNAYVGASVTTASPDRLLVMLCERLVLDIERGLDAQRTGRRDEANTQLQHAQDIVMELSTSLRPEVWSGAADLAALYDWMHSQLVMANVHGDEAMTTHMLALAEQLRDTWRQAAQQRLAS